MKSVICRKPTRQMSRPRPLYVTFGLLEAVVVLEGEKLTSLDVHHSSWDADELEQINIW